MNDKQILITVDNPDVITPEYWERLEYKIELLLIDYNVTGQIFNEITSNSITINKKD